MCDCDLLDPPQMFEECFPKARKNYRCYECHLPIPKGEKYHRASGKWEGEFRTFKTCTWCWLLWRAAEMYDCCMMFGGLREAISELEAAQRWRS